jgi:hypothetical protein
MTKKYRSTYIILMIVSLILNLFPVAFYVVKAFMESSATYQKVALSSTIFISLILTCVSLLTKVNIRSIIWILFIGLYVCLDSIINMIWFIAIFQVTDELVITPLKKMVKNKWIINKELDKRL